MKASVRRAVRLDAGPSALLPTHVRPVLSRLRPSAHSQRNEPWVLTQRPLVQTPGKTSHSLMSAGHSRGGGLLQTGIVSCHSSSQRGGFTFTDEPLHPSEAPGAAGVCGDGRRRSLSPGRLGDGGQTAVRGTLTDLAGFAGAPPGGAQRGAALGLERGSVDVDLTAAVLDAQPAGALHAVCGGHGNKVRGR